MTLESPGTAAAFEWIETREGLLPALDLLAREPAVGVDLEADSLFHFQEKVCLLQLAATDRVFLVDPLAVGDLSPLAPLFANPDVIKILHGSDYDLRSLDRDFNIRVHGLFDTQIAARFLGLDETGLGNLLETRFGVRAEKKFQKKDWSVRPLPDEMLRYGAQDALYLVPLYRMLREELRGLGRLSWVEEECAIQSGVRHAPPDEGPLFLRLRGAGHLDPRGLAVAEELLRFRMNLASKRDRPPFKVLGNQAILELARRRPTTSKELASVPGVSKGLIRVLGSGLVQCIHEAMETPEGSLPVYPRKTFRRQGSGVIKRVRALKEWRNKRAGELGLDPSVLLTNAQIQALAVAKPSRPGDLAPIEGIRRWQQESFGRALCEVTARGK
ncbi:MAG: HRDC domain-containing protein [Deltaproteobacteria bacterium]|nr:HRDC domain-containing protein [Deltaproteobacteria bacterium]